MLPSFHANIKCSILTTNEEEHSTVNFSAENLIVLKHQVKCPI